MRTRDDKIVRVWPLGHDRVYKGDHHRLQHEGLWLQQHASLTLPRVYSVSKTSYEMERLIRPPWTLMDHRTTLIQLFYNLNRIWQQEPTHVFNPQALDEYLSILLSRETSPPVPPLGKIAQHINWETLSTGLIHGNAYLHNIMFREESENLVLISPKQSSYIIPDMPCVDVGMILASILGADGIWVTNARTLRILVDDDNEWAASVFWCVVHLIEKLGKTSDENAKNKIWQMINEAGELI